MGNLYLEVLPFALAVAFSPMPIVGLLLILLSRRSYVNSIAYAVGWVVGLALLVIGVSYFFSGRIEVGGSHIFGLVMGILLLIFGIREWIGRPQHGKSAQKPRWIKAIESISPPKAFGLGFLFAVVNLKNTPVGIAVAKMLGNYGGWSSEVFGFVFYLLIASCAVVIPVAVYLIFGRRLYGIFGKLNAWLVLNNSVILAVLFMVLGFWMILKATNS